MSDTPNVREKLALVQDWLSYNDEQLSYGLRNVDDAVILYDAAMSSMNGLGEMADEWPEAERIRLLGYDPMQADAQPKQIVVMPRWRSVEFIKQQLAHDYESHLAPDKVAHHYGKVELRELMDFIYGGEPRLKREKL